MFVRVCAVVSCAVLLVAAQYNPTNCEAVLKQKGKRYKYDLTPLYHMPQTAYDNLASPVGDDIAYFNFCGESSMGCMTGPSSVCIRTSNWDYYSGGLLKTQTYSDSDAGGAGKAVRVTYSDGDSGDCPSSVGRQSIINIVCQTDADPGYFEENPTSNNCVYTFKLFSKAGCGVSMGGGVDAAGVILILFFVGLVLYFVVGWCLNKFVFKKEGSFFELIPNYTFWVALPGLIKDGCLFIAHGFKKGDYVSV